MARVKLSEYKAKKLLLGEAYRGIQIKRGEEVPEGTWVAKVDQGVKKRMKQGLVRLQQSSAQVREAVSEWNQKGYEQFLVEPYFAHEQTEEQYLSFERMREGICILHAREGGIDIEKNPETLANFLIRNEAELPQVARATEIPEAFLRMVFEAFNKYFFSFLEINPLVVRGGEVFLLDAAVLVDSAGAFFTQKFWSEADFVAASVKHEAEARIEALDATTPASLKLSVLNPNGSLFFLLSAGGGSIVVADEAKLLGAGREIGNFGEYSGGPTRQETYLYAKEIIDLLLASSNSKKVLIIAGPVANFTDVKTTFLGIVDALEERKSDLKNQKVKVFVRRGGPNEEQGLALIKDFLQKEDLFGVVAGSNEPITIAINEAVKHLNL